MKAKTISTTIQCSAVKAIAFLADPNNLPRWYRSFCRSIRKEEETWIVQTHRKAIPVRFLRDDRSGVIDFLFQFDTDFEWLVPSRVLPNGNESEFLLTLIQPEGTSEADFHRHIQWANDAVRELKKLLETAPVATRPTLVVVDPDSGTEAAPSLEAPVKTEESAPENDAPEIPLIITSKRLFIRNLPFDWTDDQLREHFTVTGQVDKAEVARFRRNGRSRGFGFVEMSNEDETRAAIEKLHGSMAGNRKITVRLSREGRANNGEAAVTSEEAPSTEGTSVVEVPAPVRRERPQSRNRRPERAQRSPESSDSSSKRRLPGGSDRNAVIETGGYEFFPRGQKPEDMPSSPSEPRRDSNSFVEPSPYFDDVGDFENRGSRPQRRGGSGSGGPGRGRRPSGGNRGPRRGPPRRTR